jgi:hypothetical protein
MTIGYIYLLRKLEHVVKNEYIYKIGRTSRMPHKRINEYPKGTEVILIKYVNDSVKIETSIIRIFNKVFKKKNHTNEYFYGHVNNMVEIIDHIINQNCGIKNNKNINDILNDIIDDNTNNNINDIVNDIIDDNTNNNINDIVNDIIDDNTNNNTNDNTNDNMNDIINDNTNDNMNDIINDNTNDNTHDNMNDIVNDIINENTNNNMNNIVNVIINDNTNNKMNDIVNNIIHDNTNNNINDNMNNAINICINNNILYTQTPDKSYRCDICDYNVNTSSNYNKHLLTKKHINKVNGTLSINNCIIIDDNDTSMYTCYYCKQKYKNNNSYKYKHVKRCRKKHQQKEQYNVTEQNQEEIGNEHMITILKGLLTEIIHTSDKTNIQIANNITNITNNSY